MQAAAAEIDRQRGATAMHAQVQAQIRRVDIHRRPDVALPAELVDDGVLDPLCGETRMREFRTTDRGIDSQRVVGIEVLAPVDALHARVQISVVVTLEVGDGPQHAVGQSRPQHQALRAGDVAVNVDAGQRCRRLVGAQRQCFVDQKVFEAARAAEKEGHLAISRCFAGSGRRRRRRTARGWSGDARHRPGSACRGAATPSGSRRRTE